MDEKIKFKGKEGLEVTGGPFQPNTNIKFFFVKDPNGINIQFVENL